MTLFLAWTDRPPEQLPAGPWSEGVELAPGLFALHSDSSLSSVYHEFKWSLPDPAALLVAPMAAAPKARRLRPGAQAWMRDRLGA